MNVFEMVALIVVFGTVASVLSQYFKSKEKTSKMQTDDRSAEADARIARLEERVQVLERIVTDKKERLKDEIDAL